MSELRLCEIAQYWACGLFDRDRQNALARDREARLATENVSHEAVNGRQAGIARPSSIVTSGLQVIEKLPDHIGRQILKPECLNRSMRSPAGELEQQLECVAIGRHGVRTHVPLGCKMANEKSGYQTSKIGARHDDLRAVMRYPKRASCRRMTSLAISSVRCK